MNGISPYRFYAFVIIVHVIYFLLAQYFQGFYLIDSYGYLMQAENLQFYHTWYAENWNAPLLIDYFSIRPPLYATVILLLNNQVIPLLILQNTLSILSICLAYQFSHKHIPHNRFSNVLIIAAVVCYPAQMIHANLVMTEILFQCCVLLLFTSSYYFLTKPTLTNATVISILLSLGLLLKPISLFFTVMVFVWLIWRCVFQKTPVSYLLIIILPLLTFHCINKQNKHATGHYHYSSITSINNLKYNARYTLIATYNENIADSIIQNTMSIAAGKLIYKERLQTMDSAALAILIANPISASITWAKGVIAFFIDPGRFDVFHFFRIETKGRPGLMHEMQTKGITAIEPYIQQSSFWVLCMLFVNILWNIFITVCFVYFILLGKQFSFRPILFSIVLYIALATGPVGVSRYRVPIYPLLFISMLASSHLLINRKKSFNV